MRQSFGRKASWVNRPAARVVLDRAAASGSCGGSCNGGVVMHIYAYVRQASFGFLLLALIGVSGCSKTPATEADSSPSAKTDPAAKPAPEPPPRPAPPRVVTLPQGTVIEARLDESLSTRTSRV